MVRRFVTLAAAIVLSASLASGASAAGPQFTPGADGIGDPYYPQDGNGGYDVGHYDLDLTLRPRHGSAERRRHDRRRRRPRTSRVRPRLRGPDRALDHVNGTAANWQPEGRS